MIRRLPIHRLLTGLVLALWAAAPLAQVAHSHHAHRYCNEHGTFEEGSPSVDRSEATGQATASAGDELSAEAGQSMVGGALEHQACPAFGSTRNEVSPIRVSLLALAAHWIQVALPEQLLRPDAPISPLTAAPKSSPPL